MEFVRFPRTVPGDPIFRSVPQNPAGQLAEGQSGPTALEGRTRPLMHCYTKFFLHRKEVIHPHVLVGIPCFDLTPITGPALGAAPPCGSGWRLRALQAFMV